MDKRVQVEMKKFERFIIVRQVDDYAFNRMKSLEQTKYDRFGINLIC